MRRHSFVLIAAALAPACTIIEVQGERPSTSYHLGVLRIEPADGAGAVAYRSRGFGIVPGLNGVTIGYRSDDAVLVTDPNQCRVVFFEQPVRERDAEGREQQTYCQTGGN